MNCPACGRDVDPAALDCPTCGHQLPNPWARPEPEEPAAPSAAPEPAAFGSPQQYAATHPGADHVVTAPVPPWQAAPTPRKRRRLLPILVLAFAVLLTGGGVATAGLYFHWFGAAEHRPAEVLPASAVAYLQLDLDPSLVQKGAAWQFLRDLPQVKEAAATGAPDPRAIAWKLLQEIPDNPLAGVDYDADVKPWLGNQLGVAVLPGTGAEPTPVVAIEVTDEARAAATLRSWAAKAHQKMDVTMRAGYALLTPPARTADILAAVDAGPLATSPTFAADVAALGDPGVMAGWVDLHAMAAIARDAGGIDTADVTSVKGRGVFSLTFEPTTLALTGRLLDLSETGPTGTVDLGELPRSTWAAFGFADGARAVRQAFPDTEPRAKEWLSEAGLDVDDLAALLGRSFSVGLSSVTSGKPGEGEPDIGARIVTDDPSRAQAALHTIAELAAGSGGPTIHDRVVEGTLLVATSQAYLDELAGGPSRLAGSEEFRAAVPDHARTSTGVWVDLSSLKRGLDPVSGEYAAFLDALRAVGVQYVAEGTGAGAWSFRLVRA